MLWWNLWQLKSSNWQKRAEAARRLGESKKRKAVPGLIDALRDENTAVRRTAAEALSKIGHPGSVEPLVWALSNLPKATKARKSGSESGADVAEYRALAEALAGAGKPSMHALLRLLRSDEKEPRQWAAYALGVIGDSEAIGPLAKALDDKRSDVRREAARALGRIGSQQAVEDLVKGLSNKDPETRRAAAEALGAIGGDRSIEALAKATEDREEAVQMAAVEGLCKIGTVEAALKLRPAIDSGKKSLRDAAMAGLRSASVAPGTAEERASIAVLSGDFQTALGEGDAAIPPLIQALSLRDPNRRMRAAEALGTLRAERGVKPLLRALKDCNEGVQVAARAALVAIGAPAVEGLREALASSDISVQCHAARALGEIGDPVSAAALANTIVQNRIASASYADPIEAARSAAEALAAILRTRAGKLSTKDLELIAALPDAFLERQPSDNGLLSRRELAVDCSHLRTFARQELLRRSE